MTKLVIIDDDQDILDLLNRYFTKNNFEVRTSTSGKKGTELIKSFAPEIVICDFKLPDYTGIEILQKIKIIDQSIQVIIITGYSDLQMAVKALKSGAFDYVTKPLYPEEILNTVKSALEKKRDHQQLGNNTQKKKVPVSRKSFVQGISPQSQLVEKHIKLIAPTDMTVIIEGETGTGKEYVARRIHEDSSRKEGPFVAVDCGAIPENLAASELFGHVKGAFTGALHDKKGCFETASGGTLFLDEIGNLSYENQVKLLRVIQERVVKRVGSTEERAIDVRLVVASNESIKDKTETGDFREDLFHRLNEFKIQLSPLRERPDDIRLFADHFITEANTQLSRNVKNLSDEVVLAFKRYDWPGNLRELNNVIKRSVLLCQSITIESECLPTELLGGNTELQFSESLIGKGTLKEVAEEAEKKAIVKALERTNNNKSKTAEILGIDRKTLYNKLKSFDLEL